MDKPDKFGLTLVGLGVVVCLLLLIIDFKIKNDLIQTAIRVDSDLRKIQVYTGTAVPRESATENGSDSVSSWNGHLRSGDVLDHAPVVETRGRFAKPETSPENEAGIADPNGGNSGEGIPAESE